MSVSSVGMRSQLAVEGLVQMRQQLADLQRQLSTGKKSDTYAGLGLDRGLAVGLRAQLSRYDSNDQTIAMLGVRLELAQNAISRMGEIQIDAKASLLKSPTIKASGQSAPQEVARGQLDELLELLNTQAGDRYLFGGRVSDRPPVESTEHVLDGDGTRTGLKQIIAERALADLGASGLGRLGVSTTGATLSLAEDVAGSPFGFKLAAATANVTGATVSGPTGSPQGVTVAFAANPTAGESITFALTLPDGTQQTVKLTATAAAPPGVGEFSIGANPTATAQNLQTALSGALGTLAKTSLAAASALAAADDFFNIDVGDPPRRVAGPPFDTATAMVAGSATNTVFWYTGEMNADAPRSSASARVDGSIAVSYGMRANEEALRSLVQNVAAFAAVTFDPNDATAAASYGELTKRLAPALAQAPDQQRLQDIASDLGNAQAIIAASKQRHQQSRSVLADLLDRVEGVPPEQVATEILALQTRLQASLQTTASLYQLNLADYL